MLISSFCCFIISINTIDIFLFCFLFCDSHFLLQVCVSECNNAGRFGTTTLMLVTELLVACSLSALPAQISTHRQRALMSWIRRGNRNAILGSGRVTEHCRTLQQTKVSVRPPPIRENKTLNTSHLSLLFVSLKLDIFKNNSSRLHSPEASYDFTAKL